MANTSYWGVLFINSFFFLKQKVRLTFTLFIVLQLITFLFRLFTFETKQGDVNTGNCH